MTNLGDFDDEVENIRFDISSASESRLGDHRQRLIEILGDFVGIKWNSEGEAILSDEKPVDSEALDLDYYRDKVDQIGSKDKLLLSKDELYDDINSLIEIFYELCQETAPIVEEEIVTSDEIIDYEKEEIVW